MSILKRYLRDRRARTRAAKRSSKVALKAITQQSLPFETHASITARKIEEKENELRPKDET